MQLRRLLTIFSHTILIILVFIFIIGYASRFSINPLLERTSIYVEHSIPAVNTRIEQRSIDIMPKIESVPNRFDQLINRINEIFAELDNRITTHSEAK